MQQVGYLSELSGICVELGDPGLIYIRVTERSLNDVAHAVELIM